jgi:hypothetical protein
MALAVITTTVLHEILPANFRVISALLYLYPVLTLGFLAVLILGDPGRIDRQKSWLRAATAGMIAMMMFANTLSAIHLVIGILDKSHFTSARELLGIGTVVWLTNIVVFALAYWDFDRGGAVARFKNNASILPAFVFPEMVNAEFVDKNWYPQFADYLSLSFNNALAFSNTDVSPIKRWAKVLSLIQAMVSLLLAALVIARAINIL